MPILACWRTQRYEPGKAGTLGLLRKSEVKCAKEFGPEAPPLLFFNRAFHAERPQEVEHRQLVEAAELVAG